MHRRSTMLAGGFATLLLFLATSSGVMAGQPVRSAERMLAPRSTFRLDAPRAEPPVSKGEVVQNTSVRKPHRRFEADVIARLGRPDPLVVDARLLQDGSATLEALAHRSAPTARRRVEVTASSVKVRLEAPTREEAIVLRLPEGATLISEAAVLRDQLRRLPSALEGSAGRPVAIEKGEGGYLLQLHDQSIPLWIPRTSRREELELTDVDVVPS